MVQGCIPTAVSEIRVCSLLEEPLRKPGSPMARSVDQRGLPMTQLVNLCFVSAQELCRSEVIREDEREHTTVRIGLQL